MTKQECIDRLLNINWERLCPVIYDDIYAALAAYDRGRELYPILGKLITYEEAKEFAAGQLTYLGLYGAANCLKNLDINSPGRFFRVNCTNQLEKIDVFELRLIWHELLYKLHNMTEERVEPHSPEWVDSNPCDPEVVWVEEDDDFLTAGRTS
ncbi:MAG: hypothetical protein IJF84_00375 [Thermoguttaceae bacterium]|nr:hypothetical protein [Thermoguttaceae bacterium]